MSPERLKATQTKEENPPNGVSTDKHSADYIKAWALVEEALKNGGGHNREMAAELGSLYTSLLEAKKLKRA